MTTTPANAFLSVPKTRILEAALQLFCERGAAGTSLQMIADAVGVTKAAVYHQFPTKDEIIIAAGRPVFDLLELVADRAEAETSPKRSRALLIDGLVDQAVEQRHVAGFLQRDPIMLQLFDQYEPYRRIMQRLDAALMHGNDTPQGRVTVAMLLTAIGSTVIHPLVANIDNETLRSQLHTLARSLLRYLD